MNGVTSVFGCLSRRGDQPSGDEGTDLSDSVVVAVYVDDAKAVMKGGLCDQQVGDWDPVPHAVVESQIELQL